MREPGNTIRFEEIPAPKGQRIITIHFDDDDSLNAQFALFMEAFQLYERRNVSYNDNWKRYGWRGCLFRVRERAERAWDVLWNSSPINDNGRDDLVDLLNLTAFTIRAFDSCNRDGEGAWWPSE